MDLMRLVGVAALLLTGCPHDRGSSATGESPSAATTPTPSAAAHAASLPVITTEAEAKAAIGQRVRVQGIAEHDKLGDAVSTKSFSVICLEPRSRQRDSIIPSKWKA